MVVKRIEELKPVYLIFGEEDLLLERALERLKARVAEVADLGLNYEAFDGETADPDAIIAAANTIPFGSERRFVVVKSVDRMPAAAQGVLAEYARDPAPTACLVLVARKLRKDSRLYKAVDALGGAYEYGAPRRSGYAGWVREQMEARGRRMTADAAETLVRAAGRDLRRLDGEIEKVIAYAGDRTEITRSDVEQVVAPVAPASVFDFINALGARECGPALEVLDDMLEGGQELLGVHTMTIRHLRTLVSVRALMDRGAGMGVLMREVGMADWQARIAVEQARRFTAAELSRAVRSAATLEAEMKSGGGEARYLFEVWAIGVCAGERT